MSKGRRTSGAFIKGTGSSDDTVTEKYFNGENITKQLLSKGLKLGR